jgi:hypothetical protein
MSKNTFVMFLMIGFVVWICWDGIQGSELVALGMGMIWGVLHDIKSELKTTNKHMKEWIDFLRETKIRRG